MKILGSTYKFTCPGCGYTVEVGGGKQFGKMTATITISCETCKQLLDIVLSEPAIKVAEPSWKPPKRIVCLECNRDLTDFWEYPDNCPKCGRRMDKGEKVATWD